MATKIKIFDDFHINLVKTNQLEEVVNDWLESMQEEYEIEIKDFKFFMASNENSQLICVYEINNK